jgi:N-acetylglucosaminyl-diphospho-decaprenol L-rhamnosyltransferase
MTPVISFVVVTWESHQDLEGLIQSMREHLPNHDSVELIVVDNASSEDPTEIARRWQGPVQIERLTSNIGFGSASNRGVRMATAPVTVLCNPDVRLSDDSVLRLCRFAVEKSALVGPRLLWGDGEIQPSASGPVIGFWPWVAALIPGALQPSAILRHTEPWRCHETVEVIWLTGAMIVAPTDLLRRLGPFDEGIELMSEDLDLGIRAQGAGVRVLFAPDLCSVTHLGGRSLDRRFPDSGRKLAASNRSFAIRRAYGEGAERRSRAALSTKLRLRRTFKTLLGRDDSAERGELEALGSD